MSDLYDLDEPMQDPRDCAHLNISKKMYCSFCEDCGVTIDSNTRVVYTATMNQEGKLSINNRIS